jgi:hypothetical protein
MLPCLIAAIILIGLPTHYIAVRYRTWWGWLYGGRPMPQGRGDLKLHRERPQPASVRR